MVSEYPMKTIRIQVGKDMEQVLKALKARYPLLDNVEIIKLSLSDFYHEEQRRPREDAVLEFRRKLEELPELVLTEEERDALTEAIDASSSDEGIILSPEEAMEHVATTRKHT